MILKMLACTIVFTMRALVIAAFALLSVGAHDHVASSNGPDLSGAATEVDGMQASNDVKVQTPAKNDSAADPLTRRYMWATIYGVLGAWIGLVILICQTIISRRTSQRQLRAYVLSESG